MPIAYHTVSHSTVSKN